MREDDEENKIKEDKPIVGKTNPVNAYVIGLSVISAFFSFAAFYAFCIDKNSTLEFSTNTAYWFIGVVLSIIGVLVALVVINNISQVNEVRRDFLNATKSLDEEKIKIANEIKILRDESEIHTKRIQKENKETVETLKYELASDKCRAYIAYAWMFTIISPPMYFHMVFSSATSAIQNILKLNIHEEDDLLYRIKSISEMFMTREEEVKRAKLNKLDIWIFINTLEQLEKEGVTWAQPLITYIKDNYLMKNNR